MRILICLAILLTLFPACERSSQNPPVLPGDFSTHILEDYFVTSMAFEKDGTAWIGTFKQGLIRYRDGQATLFDAGNSPVNDTLVIYSIAADNQGGVWVGCGGLLHYSSGVFALYNSENSPIPVDWIREITIDPSGVVWFSSSRFREGGLVRFDGINWEVFTPEVSPLPDHLIQGLCADRMGNIWIALSGLVDQARLARISGRDWHVYTDEDLGFSPYYWGTMDVNSRNQVFVSIDYTLSSLWQHPGPDLIKFDGNVCEQIQADSIRRYISFITIDRNDRVWCGGYDQLSIYDRGTWSSVDWDFSETGIFAIEQSPDGRMWLGTGQGIFISD